MWCTVRVRNHGSFCHHHHHHQPLLVPDRMKEDPSLSADNLFHFTLIIFHSDNTPLSIIFVICHGSPDEINSSGNYVGLFITVQSIQKQMGTRFCSFVSLNVHYDIMQRKFYMRIFMSVRCNFIMLLLCCLSPSHPIPSISLSHVSHISSAIFIL